SAEPALAELFSQGDLFAALVDVAQSTKDLEGPDSVPFDERARQMLWQWIRNDDGYVMRSGPSSIELGDGRTLESLSRIEVILKRAEDFYDRLEDKEELHD